MLEFLVSIQRRTSPAKNSQKFANFASPERDAEAAARLLRPLPAHGGVHEELLVAGLRAVQARPARFREVPKKDLTNI